MGDIFYIRKFFTKTIRCSNCIFNRRGRDGEVDMNHFIRNKNALAGVIEALLLVALVSIVISMIQLIYIPEIMEQRESDHMDQVENQFSLLKSNIDIQSATGQDMPLSSLMTLGSKDLPYFVTAGAFGSLDIIDEIETESMVRINPPLSGVGEYSGEFNIPLTCIKYESHNVYFVPQTYILEGGAILVVQDDGETGKVEPSMIIKNESSSIDISYRLPILVGITGKKSMWGYKNCYIRTNMSHNETYTSSLTDNNLHYFRIYSDYLDGWYQTLQLIFEREIDNGYITITKEDAINPPYVEIKKSGTKRIDISLEVVYVGAQIGPGVVET